jgi:hypothetical protein
MAEQIDLEALARAIAPHLNGGTWQYQPQPADQDRRKWWATITGPNGAEIHLTYRDKRVNVYGEYPKDQHNRYVMDSVKRYNEALPSITVSPSRPPQALAADIQRRFLPEYLGYLVKAQEEVARRKAYDDKRNSLLDYACGFLGTRQYGEPTDYKRSTGAQLAPAVSVKVEVSDQAKVTLEVDGIANIEELRDALKHLKRFADTFRPE